MTDDYFDGLLDCWNDIPHERGKSEEYDKGYSDQYAKEQKAEEDYERHE